jgi:hypothetical protein
MAFSEIDSKFISYVSDAINATTYFRRKGMAVPRGVEITNIWSLKVVQIICSI